MCLRHSQLEQKYVKLFVSELFKAHAEASEFGLQILEVKCWEFCVATTFKVLMKRVRAEEVHEVTLMVLLWERIPCIYIMTKLVSHGN